MSFKNIIIDARNSKEPVAWTRWRLANESGLGQTQIKRIEEGKRTPSLKTAKILLEVLGIESVKVKNL